MTDKDRWISRELRRGLLRAVREERWTVALLVAGVAISCELQNYPSALAGLMLIITYVFAMFFKNEAREGWQKASELADRLKQEETK